MIDSVVVCRQGTALVVQARGSSPRLVRRCDLSRVLGATGVGARRFGAARVVGDSIEVDYVGGGSERIDGAHLGARSDRAELILTNIGRLATCDGDGDDVLGISSNSAIVAGGGRILWVGPGGAVDGCGFDLSAAVRIDAGGRLVTPGLIDCHAHPLFAGNRADEFGKRAAGANYLDIAAAGGGISATLIPTRAASFDEHMALTSIRLDRALAAGTTTCEAKSGYDLTVEGELRLLEIAHAVDAVHVVDLVPTLLGAHVLPPDRTDDRDTFVAEVCEQMIPRAAAGQLASAVDVYCDDGAFTLAEARAILEAGRANKLALRAHAGQFADLGCAELVAELGGLSADHVENISDSGIAAMASHGVVAVMLPGACVQLRTVPPPVAAFRSAGVAMAVATDMNPGTSYCETLPIAMWLATTHYGMTVAEAWLGVTKYAARALGRSDIGIVEVGAAADLAVWDAESPAEIPYHYGANLLHTVIKRGYALD